MGLLDFFLGLIGLRRRPAPPEGRRNARPARKPQQKPTLHPLRSGGRRRRKPPRGSAQNVETDSLPYRFAHLGIVHGGYLDLSGDADPERLEKFGLPDFRTPVEIADWLAIPVGKLAWLVHRFSPNYRPEDEHRAHYHFHWMKKRTGGWRLIESPKSMLKAVQSTILKDILDRIPPHAAAHGFRAGRSVVTNARPHVGMRVVVKLDLESFYSTVTFSRVTAIFRSVGYSREAAIWLARLTTSALPPSLPFPEGDPSAILPFLPRHLPQGAPTSPALANLSAFGLDVRLCGFARAFGANYTRYADDLTFSGPDAFLRGLRVFLPLSAQIVRSERFRVNRRKRRVIRNHQRQIVAGVVVNQRINGSRDVFDRLKAILTNCVRHGAAMQNRDNVDNFYAHLRGRIAHVQQLNAARGAKLLALFEHIDWQE